MKRILSFLTVCILLFSCEENQVEIGNRTTLEVAEFYDAGNVEKGEVINASFTVKNTGEYPLVIARVQPSCSCTLGEYPEEPIQPGQEGVITAQVDTDKLELGPINKSLTIVSNTKPSTIKITVKANVVRK